MSVGRIDYLLEALHALHIFSARLGNRRVGKIYLVAFEILWLLTFSLLNHPLAKLTHHNLHHRQMFQIVVCLKKRVSNVELYQDTAYTEHVTRIRP